MGSECSEDEREFRYLTFHQAIYAIDKDIKKELNSTNRANKKFILFGLVNQGIFKKYKFLSNENFDKNEARKTKFDYKYLIEKDEKKDFKYIHKNFEFYFPSNFIFVYKDFMSIILDYVDNKYRKYLSSIYNVIVGGDCLIMKDEKDKNDDLPFRFIILYSELKENKGNEIDFFFYFKDKKERISIDKYIMENNLWSYFKKINYNYKDEYKKIMSENNREIGYVVRCCSVEKVESFINKFNNKEKEINNSVKISHINFGNNFKQEMIQNNKDNINISLNSNQYKINKGNNASPWQKDNNNDTKCANNIINNNINNMQSNKQNLNINNNSVIQNINGEINNLKDEISILKKREEVNLREIDSLKKENNNLKKTIQLKEDENNKLKSKIDILVNQKDKKPNLVDFDNIKIIQFLSTDHSVIYPIKCLPSDTFAEVEEKLYKIYPEYRETNNSFQVDGRNILRFKTIAENNIQEGHHVHITIIE